MACDHSEPDVALRWDFESGNPLSEEPFNGVGGRPGGGVYRAPVVKRRVGITGKEHEIAEGAREFGTDIAVGVVLEVGTTGKRFVVPVLDEVADVRPGCRSIEGSVQFAQNVGDELFVRHRLIGLGLGAHREQTENVLIGVLAVGGIVKQSLTRGSLGVGEGDCRRVKCFVEFEKRL
jgi:hypothetical protein